MKNSFLFFRKSFFDRYNCNNEDAQDLKNKTKQKSFLAFHFELQFISRKPLLVLPFS
jgi:hypothetical protein